MYCSPSGSSAHGIPQEKILEWESSPGNLPNPAIKLGLLHCRRVLYHLSHQVRLNYPLKDPLSKYWCLLRLFGLGLKHTDLGRAHSAHQLLIYVPWDMGEAGRRKRWGEDSSPVTEGTDTDHPSQRGPQQEALGVWLEGGGLGVIGRGGSEHGVVGRMQLGRAGPQRQTVPRTY